MVVQDPYHPTETSRLADVLLPTSQWAEKTLTSTNSERLVSYSEQVINPPGLAWPDWQIIARFGEAMGYPGFDFQDSSQVWDEFIELTAGRPCDMSGMASRGSRPADTCNGPVRTPTTLGRSGFTSTESFRPRTAGPDSTPDLTSSRGRPPTTSSRSS